MEFNELVIKEVLVLLTAINETGKKFCLGNENQKEELKILRKKEKFFCPVCGESVLLKLGDHRIPHFSHKKGSNCTDFYERESVYHMEGKLQLYQWLIRQKIPAELEFYDKKIKQRPDIMFIYNGIKYALEYQCSVISEADFIKRTNTYLKSGYEPIWIIGGKHIRQTRNVLTLSNFHYLFIRKNDEGLVFIPSYCPETHLFHFIDSIFPYSTQKAFVHHFLIPQSQMDLNGFLAPKISGHLQVSRWVSVTEKFNLQWSLRPDQKQHSFLNEIYKHHLNLYLLPPEIGLPVRHSFLIQTSPIIWQTYLFIDILLGKKNNQIISLHEIQQAIKRRIQQKEIIIRQLPRFQDSSYFQAVIEYLCQLEMLGILSRKDDRFFQVKRRVTIPTSNREKTEKKNIFLKENLQMLSKI